MRKLCASLFLLNSVGLAAAVELNACSHRPTKWSATRESGDGHSTSLTTLSSWRRGGGFGASTKSDGEDLAFATGGGRKGHGKGATALTTATERVDDLRVSARRWRRRELLALFLARIGFVFLLPISTAAFALSLVVSILLTALRIATLNFCFREISRILYAATKALLAVVFASVTGFVLPIFALFGLVASATEAGCEMVEPILRIRYRRQLRKLHHLQEILTDPVLMETTENLLRGAEAATALSVRGAQRVGSATGRHIETTSRFAIGAGRKVAKTAAQQIEDQSAQLVEVLVQSPEMRNLRESIESKIPERMKDWTKDQLDSLRRSGVLEEAAQVALTALKKELKAASSFLPYLEAIKEVRDEQARITAKEGR